MVRQDKTRSSWLAAAAIAVALCVSGCSAVADHPFVSNGRGRPADGGGTAARLSASRQTRALELAPGPPGTARPPEPKAKVQPGETEHMSPDGQWVAVESGKGAARTLAVGRRDTSERRRVSGGHPAAAPSWAPDSRLLVFSAREFRDPDLWVVWVFDVATARTTRVGSAAGTRPPAVAWFPDARRFCYGKDERLVVVNMTTGEVSALAIPGGGRAVGAPAVSPDGRRVVFAVAGDGAWIASVEDGRFVRLVGDSDVDALAWAPGGREVALRNASDGRWQVKVIRQ